MASIIIIILVSATVILSVYSLFFIKMPRSYKIISLSSLIISIKESRISDPIHQES